MIGLWFESNIATEHPKVEFTGFAYKKRGERKTTKLKVP